MAESEGQLKSLLISVKEESEKAGLKLNIQKTKIMTSSPITSWQIEGEKVEATTYFLCLDSKIMVTVTAAIKLRHLILGRKGMTNLDSVLESRDISLPTKFYIVKAMVFPAVMYGCESWTIKKAKS